MKHWLCRGCFRNLLAPNAVAPMPRSSLVSMIVGLMPRAACYLYLSSAFANLPFGSPPASLRGYSVITTLPASVPAITGLIHRYGVSMQCSVRAAGVPVLALEDPASGAVDSVRSEIRRAVAEDRAECIILGCAGMADLARNLSFEFGLPVIDGVAAAVKFAEALAGLGLMTSKSGGYAVPSAKPYLGLLAAFSPEAIGS